MQNMRILGEHGAQKLQQGIVDRPWQLPQVILTPTGADHWQELDGSFWRALSFIDQAQSFDTIQSRHHAEEIGYALGLFHQLVSDLDPEQLVDTLEGFHITPQYLHQYHRQWVRFSVEVSQSASSQPLSMEQVRQAAPETLLGLLPRSRQTQADPKELHYCCAFIQKRQTWASVLETAKAQGHLYLRPIHGDPKVNNILIHKQSQRAISMVDLDTVKPGLIHYDIGDCLRSGCNVLGEEVREWQTVQFDLDLCRAILQGYLAIACQFMTEADYAYIYDSIRLMAFELGLRFFTDYLAGDVYFRTEYPTHNLARALVQFKLTEQIEAQETAIRTLIQKFDRSDN